jgi:hypothetical protein
VQIVVVCTGNVTTLSSLQMTHVFSQVIYVDADQVVRADLAELWNLDLQGHAYAYTPFCTSREETLGFQFWQQGYWKDHLRGRPYHISALYVVDLQRFRYACCRCVMCWYVAYF